MAPDGNEKTAVSEKFTQLEAKKLQMPFYTFFPVTLASLIARYYSSIYSNIIVHINNWGLVKRDYGSAAIFFNSSITNGNDVSSRILFSCCVIFPRTYPLITSESLLSGLPIPTPIR